MRYESESKKVDQVDRHRYNQTPRKQLKPKKAKALIRGCVATIKAT
jgi:hypothetical protein